MKRFVFCIFSCVACVEPYNPPALNEHFDAMVVDGYIDLDGSAMVKLSRGMPLNVSIDPPIESGATVTIESSSGEIFSLHENDPGTYTASGLHVDKHSTYVLHFTTNDNIEYRSDNVKIYSSPSIDSVYWTINGANQLQIMVDSHDDSPDAPGFYLANGIETYEYHAPVYSQYKFINKVAVPRLPGEDVYICWRDNTTSNVLASTKSLNKNVMSGLIISTIDRNSQKISARYSVLARLRAVSQEEFAFQKKLISSTEQTGTLFSQIPGTVVSNVHPVKNSDEYVLGYFRGQEVKELRYFISLYEHPLPERFQVPPSNKCQVEATCRFDIPNPIFCIEPGSLGDDTIITSVVLEKFVPIQYIFTTADCGDCRMQGGVTTEPAFW